MTDAERVEPYSEVEIATIRKVADLDDAVVEAKHFLATLDALSSRLAAVERERDEARRALACEEAYKHASQSNDWMATLSAAGWDGKSNPRPFINALRRAALEPKP